MATLAATSSSSSVPFWQSWDDNFSWVSECKRGLKGVRLVSQWCTYIPFDDGIADLISRVSSVCKDAYSTLIWYSVINRFNRCARDVADISHKVQESADLIEVASSVKTFAIDAIGLGAKVGKAVYWLDKSEFVDLSAIKDGLPLVIKKVSVAAETLYYGAKLAEQVYAYTQITEPVNQIENSDVEKKKIVTLLRIAYNTLKVAIGVLTLAALIIGGAKAALVILVLSTTSFALSIIVTHIKDKPNGFFSCSNFI